MIRAIGETWYFCFIRGFASDGIGGHVAGVQAKVAIVFSLYSESNVPLCMQSKQKQMSSGYRGLEIMHKCRYGWLKGNQGSLNSNKQINSKMHKIASDNSIMGVYSLYVQGTVYSVIQQLHKCQDLQAPGRPTVRQTPELDTETSRFALVPDWTITVAIFFRLVTGFWSPWQVHHPVRSRVGQGTFKIYPGERLDHHNSHFFQAWQVFEAPGRSTIQQSPELDREPSRSTLAQDWTITVAIFFRLDRFLKPLAGSP
jgi:hypothetical protein